MVNVRAFPVADRGVPVGAGLHTAGYVKRQDYVGFDVNSEKGRYVSVLAHDLARGVCMVGPQNQTRAKGNKKEA